MCVFEVYMNLLHIRSCTDISFFFVFHTLISCLNGLTEASASETVTFLK